jgi:tetratricopeptide (TPR) repeat protein
MTLRALLVAAVLARAGAAAADPVDPATQAKADALFEKAQAHYQAGEYQAAIELFKSGYALVHDPIYLFNLGQSYRKVLDCVAATDYYHRYLAAAPAAPNKDKVDGWIRELADCTEQRTAEHDAMARAQAKLDRAAELRRRLAALRVDTGRGYRLAGEVAAGAGLVGLALGVGFAVHSSNLAGDIRTDCAAGCQWGTAMGLDADGRNANTIATVGLVAGGIAVLAGVGLYYYGHTRAAVEVTPTSVSARVAF